MIVVSDTSPLNYLALLGHTAILASLYEVVHIPPAVQFELTALGAPDVVRHWALSSPEWLHIQPPHHLLPNIDKLDAGEHAAISMAVELGATALLVDESKARRVATKRYSLRTTGTLGILRDAHKANLMDARAAFITLRVSTNFRCDSEVAQLFLNSLES